MKAKPITPEEIKINKWLRPATRITLATAIFGSGFVIGREVTTEVHHYDPTPMQAAALKFTETHPEQFRIWVADPTNEKLMARIGGWDSGLTVIPSTPAMELCQLAGKCGK